MDWNDVVKNCEDAMRGMPCTWVQPREFFVAHCGVPVLAYVGFSGPLLLIKQGLENLIPGLKPENPGAKWPKTSLGSLKDGRVLSLSEAKTLRQICAKVGHGIDRDKKIPVESLSVVEFGCRSLEQLKQTVQIPLGSVRSNLGPPAWHVSKVAALSIVAMKPKAMADYYRSGLSRDGNREGHYRTPHSEFTLVWELRDQRLAYIDRFIQEVDQALPGRYAWFSEQSRHMTIRGLA